MDDAAPKTTRGLSDAELALLDGVVTSLVEARKGVAAFQALETSLMAAAMALGMERVDAASGDGDLPVREIAAEIGAALRVSDRTVQRRLAEAQTVASRFAATLAALTEGRISQAHVAVIVEAGDRIDDDDARAGFERAALAYAEHESAARLRPVARVLAERAMPTTLAERHERARHGRAVTVRDVDDGMSELAATVPSALAHGIHSRLTDMANAVKGAGPDDERSLDQLRADLLCDLALTGVPTGHDDRELLGAIRAEVHVTVPVLTLAGCGGDPAVIEGSAPIDPDTARTLCGAATGWDRVLTHPVTGAVLAVDRYRPTAELKRLLRARDQRCRFPGCRLPVHRADLDHVHDHARGGPTAVSNLAAECRRHHVLKHHTAWSVALDDAGIMTWTSPTGRVYPDHPPSELSSGVAFQPDPPPPF